MDLMTSQDVDQLKLLKQPLTCLLLPSALGTTLAIMVEAKPWRWGAGAELLPSRFCRVAQNSPSDSNPPCTSCRHSCARPLHARPGVWHRF